MFLCNNCVNCNKYHFISYGTCESCKYTGPCNDCPSFHTEKKKVALDIESPSPNILSYSAADALATLNFWKKEEKMERVKIEIPLVCGCSITERLDPLNSGELLRPIYSKHVLQNDAVKNTQYITFNRSPHCTEHNSKKKNNKLTVEKIKNIIRLNFPERLSSEDVDDLYNFLESRRR